MTSSSPSRARGERAARLVLVINAGSSSLKYDLLDADAGTSWAHGSVERIGEETSSATLTCGARELRRDGAPIADHASALRTAFDLFDEAGAHLASVGLVAVGHRVVHGGPTFYEPTLVTDELIARLEDLAPLAPLHNPPSLLGIQVARTLVSDVPHVAVFDTAFFHDLPAAAASYAIDRDVAERWRIRRYGFHGTSHQYISAQAAIFLGRSPGSLNQIVLHLGNGASASAIAGGRPIDTSMGLTPLEGLVMGTRPGDLDPGVLVYLARTAGMTVDDIDALLNRHSGLYGLAGANDFRELRDRVDAHDEAATLAYDVYVHRLRKYIGAYLALLGTTDVITFTAGVGENDAGLRRDALTGMATLGIEVDEQRNASPARAARQISSPSSRTTVLVIPTNEELAIARACLRLIKR